MMPLPARASGSLRQDDGFAAPAPAAVDASGWTQQQRTAFLDALATASDPETAAATAGHPLANALRLRRHCAEFARGWAEAIDFAIDLVEVKMLHQAAHGVPREIVRDRKIYRVLQHSTALTIFALRSCRPGKYAPSRAQPMPEVTPGMSRSDIVRRLRQLSLRVAAEDAGKPIEPLAECGDA
jgi:hypothetical protein